MPQKHDMTAPKMTRVTVRVPKTTLDQINDWVDTLGVRRSHFLGIALVAGVRSLIRASSLEMALAPEGESHPDASQAGEEQTAKPASIETSSPAQMLDKLRAENAALQSEITTLRNQLQTLRGPGKRRS